MDDEDDTDKDTKTTPPVGGKKDGTTDTPTGQEGGAGETTYTQAQLDSLMGQRAKRAERSTLATLFEELGVADQTELTTILEGHRERADAERSDLEKAQAEVASLKGEQTRLIAQGRQTRIEAKVLTSAVSSGFVTPADALSLANLSGVEIDDEGKVTGVKEALDALLEERPYLKESASATPPKAPDIDAGRGKGTGAGGEQPSVQHLLPSSMRKTEQK